MTFNWIGLLKQHRIHYVTSGPNTPRGAISIRCPFCGVADPSEHMVIKLSGRGWHCWRNNEHRGRHPAYLVAAVLNCSLAQAMELTRSSALVDRNRIADVKAILTATVSKPPTPVPMPKEFKPFSTIWSARPFIDYLSRRQLFLLNTEGYTSRFDMYYAISGVQKGRVVFTVRYRDQLVSWTGRTIYNVAPRYKALTCDPELARRQGIEAGQAPVNHYLLWYDRLLTSKAKAIVLVEGPTDALRISLLGEPEVCATCFFTSMPTPQQVNHLRVLLPHFERRYLLLDSDARSKSLHLQRTLQPLGVRAVYLPKGVADPAVLVDKSQLLACLADF